MDLAGLFGRRLVLVTGKGGIGKSLIAASLATSAAARGKRVCLIESAAQDQLAPLFGRAPVGHNLTTITPNLQVINLNSQDNFSDFVVIHLGHRGLFEKIFTKSIVASFIRMIPGIAELTLLGRMFYYAELCKDPVFDLVVLDGYASGHFMSLVKTPEAIIGSGLIGPVLDETRRVKEYIENPLKTTLVHVTTAAELVVGESLEFLQRFGTETSLTIGALIVNRGAMPPVLAGSGPLGAYLLRHQRVFEDNLSALKRGLKDVSWRDERPLLTCLPELGAVPEPLTPAFVDQWFASSRDEGRL